MDLSGDVHGRDINFVDSRCSFEITSSSLRDKCGYAMSLTGKCITGMGLTEISDIHLKDQWSDVDIAYYSMGYEHFSDWGEYVDHIPMKGEFRQSRLAMRSLAYFMGVMQDCPVVLDIEKGGIDGPVNNLTINTLKCKDLYSGVELEIGGHLKDICIIPQASLTVDLQRLAFDTPSLEKLIGAFTPPSLSGLRIQRCRELWYRSQIRLDPELLWLWPLPVAMAPIRPLAWEPPHAVGVAL